MCWALVQEITVRYPIVGSEVRVGQLCGERIWLHTQCYLICYHLRERGVLYPCKWSFAVLLVMRDISCLPAHAVATRVHIESERARLLKKRSLHELFTAASP